MKLILDLAPEAEADIDDILEWSVQHFGEAVRDGYEELIQVAIGRVVEDPNRVGSHTCPEFGPGVRSIHLASSRDHVGQGVHKVMKPRHFVFYRQIGDTVQIVRLLHEAMNISKQFAPKKALLESPQNHPESGFYGL